MKAKRIKALKSLPLNEMCLTHVFSGVFFTKVY